jgi:6,7-dimethyl-8-ribityllumazine synthase
VTRDARAADRVEPVLDGSGMRIAVVCSRFNDHVTLRLLDGVERGLARHGVSPSDVTVVWVPGAFEIPLAARRLAAADAYDGVACLGAVIRGETAHFDFVARECARGVQQAAADSGVPMAFGVLTTDTLEQALSRAGGKHGNKGWDAAMAVMQIASVLEQIPRKD